MPGSARMQLTEITQFIHRQVVAGEMQRCVQQHRGVPVGEHEPIAIGPGRIGRIVTEDAQRDAVREREPVGVQRNGGVLREALGDLSTPRAWRTAPSDGGTERLAMPTSSREAIVSATMRLFDDHARRGRRIHRLGLSMGGVVAEDAPGIQPDLFENAEKLSGERRRQEAISAVKKKFGKNSLLRGIDLLPEATARERNGQIGGHRSGE